MVLAATILVQGFINMAGTIFISAGHWRAMLVGSLVMLAVLVPGLLAGYAVGRALGDAMPGVHWASVHIIGRPTRLVAADAGHGVGIFADDLPGVVFALHAVLPAAGRRLAG